MPVTSTMIAPKRHVKRDILTPVLLFTGLLTCVVGSVDAGELYVGGTYSQNFNTLAFVPENGVPAWVNDTTLPGWFATRTQYRIDDGTNNTGDLYSYGAVGNTERALGSIASGSTNTIRFGLELINGTGRAIDQFTLNYFGEQWRRGDQSVVQNLDFSYSLAATSLTVGTYTDFDPLDFTSSQNGSPATALDGNAAANRSLRSGTITGINWAPGTSLWLRWTDLDSTQSDNGMAVDDLTFTTPVPEPSSLALASIAALCGAFGAWRRRARS
jgi:hypothetical protein